MPVPMKIRASMQGDVADIKILMTHDMETGQRKDAKTGQTIPANFIQEVTVSVGGKAVLNSQWSQAVSKNPFMQVKVKGAKSGDKIVVSCVDNKGERSSSEAAVG